MNIKIKLLSLLLAICFCLPLMSCNGGNSGNVDKEYPIKPIKELHITCADEVTREYSKAEIEVYYNDGNNNNVFLVGDDEAQIKLRGNSANMITEKLTYTIKFSQKENVLGSGAGKKYALVSNSHDKALIRNALAYDFGKLLGFEFTPEYDFVDVWVNDTYVGNYILVETIEIDDTRVDIDVESGDYLLEVEEKRTSSGTTYITTNRYGIRFAIDDMDTVTSEQKAEVLSLLDAIEGAIASGDIDTISEYVDIDSVIDFFIHEELFKNIDFAFSSSRYYIKDGKLYGGPIWDFDLSSGNISNADDKNKRYNNYNKNGESHGNGSGNSYECLWTTEFAWTKALMDCEEFRDRLIARYEELQPKIENLYRDNELGKNAIDALLDRYGFSFAKNYTPKAEGGAGWELRGKYIGRYADATFEENVEYLRNWLKKRNEWLLEYYKSL